MSSNGSTSMASVCGATLALMDAGVPITAPVAGISCGLVTGKDGKRLLLTDIIGAEDHFGDMDFKVCGTRDGITGFQLDLKLPGIPIDLLCEGMERNRIARLKILDVMEACIPAPRADISPRAPRLEVVKINPDKIGALIGPGGKNIRSITEETARRSISTTTAPSRSWLRIKSTSKPPNCGFRAARRSRRSARSTAARL